MTNKQSGMWRLLACAQDSHGKRGSIGDGNRSSSCSACHFQSNCSPEPLPSSPYYTVVTPHNQVYATSQWCLLNSHTDAFILEHVVSWSQQPTPPCVQHCPTLHMAGRGEVLQWLKLPSFATAHASVVYHPLHLFLSASERPRTSLACMLRPAWAWTKRLQQGSPEHSSLCSGRLTLSGGA